MKLFKTIVGVLALLVVLVVICIYTVLAAPLVWVVNTYCWSAKEKTKRSTTPGMYP